MNNLQNLIKLRGLTVLSIAKDIGYGYHMTQKVIKGVRYKRKDGSFGTYSNVALQRAVADRLGLDYDQVWGTKSPTALQRLIRKEIKDSIKRQAKQQEHNLRQQFLDSNRIAENQVGGNV